MSERIVVWFRRDLRLADNAALCAAIKQGAEIIPLYIWSPDEEYPWAPGGASRWWLHHSLSELESELEEKGSYLIIRTGETLLQIREVLRETKASAIYWNRLYDPPIVERDKKLKEVLSEEGHQTKSFPGYLLVEPWSIQNSSKKPFQVFTPYWKKLNSSYEHEKPLSKPKALSSPKKAPKSLELSDLQLLPTISWDSEFYKCWKPGEREAQKRLKGFARKSVDNYKSDRDRADFDATSQLSAPLHFGEITPRQVWQEINKEVEKESVAYEKAEAFLRQIAWREFSHQLLFHFPGTDLEPLREDFKKFPWKKSKRKLEAWQRGQTGYPLVDAGMRQLWATGIMHNRVRMVVASFLVKHLLIPWQEGAKWFWDTLVDADLANNTMGWQWTSGCGADAAPYFRVFNPIIQGEKFDPEGKYVRQWIPELGDLPTKWIHRPWEAPKEVLLQANLKLGRDYPKPIVEHREARDRALEAYDVFKGRS